MRSLFLAKNSLFPSWQFPVSAEQGISPQPPIQSAILTRIAGVEPAICGDSLLISLF
jgi:hypothetical protein